MELKVCVNILNIWDFTFLCAAASVWQVLLTVTVSD